MSTQLKWRRRLWLKSMDIKKKKSHFFISRIAVLAAAHLKPHFFTSAKRLAGKHLNVNRVTVMLGFVVFFFNPSYRPVIYRLKSWERFALQTFCNAGILILFFIVISPWQATCCVDCLCFIYCFQTNPLLYNKLMAAQKCFRFAVAPSSSVLYLRVIDVHTA